MYEMKKGQPVSVVSGTILTPDEVLYDKALVMEDRLIGGIYDKDEIPDSIPQNAILAIPHGLICPGLKDILRYGRNGYSGEITEPAELIPLCEKLVAEGITGFLCTIANPNEEVLAALSEYIVFYNSEPTRARVLGIHLEAPYLSPQQPGCLAKYIKQPNPKELKRWLAIAGENIKMMTLAPEIVESEPEIIDMLRDNGVMVSIGHSEATLEQICAADYASCVTHFPNGMDIDKRNSGVFSAALYMEQLYVSIIADDVHFCLNDWAPILIERKGTGKIILVTDAVPPTDLPERNEYQSIGGQLVWLEKGKITLRDNPDTIAGSCLHLNIAVRNMTAFCPTKDAIAMATINPMRLLGLASRYGSLKEGKAADITILSADDYQVMATIIDGHLAYLAPDVCPKKTSELQQ